MKTLAQHAFDVDDLLVPVRAAERLLDRALRERMPVGMTVHVQGPASTLWPENLRYHAKIGGHLSGGDIWVIRQNDGEVLNIMPSWTAEYWSL